MAPSATIASNVMTASCRSGVAVRIGGGVSPFEAHLMRPHPVRLQEESGVKLHAALGPHVDLGHPPSDAVRIELLVPRRVETVGEVNALAVAADLDHLRSAVQRFVRVTRVRCAAHDASEPDRARLL